MNLYKNTVDSLLSVLPISSSVTNSELFIRAIWYCLSEQTVVAVSYYFRTM